MRLIASIGRSTDIRVSVHRPPLPPNVPSKKLQRIAAIVAQTTVLWAARRATLVLTNTRIAVRSFKNNLPDYRVATTTRVADPHRPIRELRAYQYSQHLFIVLVVRAIQKRRCRHRTACLGVIHERHVRPVHTVIPNVYRIHAHHRRLICQRRRAHH